MNFQGHDTCLLYGTGPAGQPVPVSVGSDGSFSLSAPAGGMNVNVRGYDGAAWQSVGVVNTSQLKSTVYTSGGTEVFATVGSGDGQAAASIPQVGGRAEGWSGSVWDRLRTASVGDGAPLTGVQLVALGGYNGTTLDLIRSHPTSKALMVALTASSPPTAVTLQSAATAIGTGTDMDVSGLAVVELDIAITATASVVVKGSRDGVTFDTLQVLVLGSTLSVVSTTTATNRVLVQVAPFKYLRADITAYTSGSVTVIGQGSVTGRPNISTMIQGTTGSLASITDGSADAVSASSNGLLVLAQGRVYNGTNWDRIRTASADALAATGMPAAGNMAYTGSGWDRVRMDATTRGLYVSQVASQYPAAVTMQNAAVATGNGTDLDVSGLATAHLSITISATATVTFKASVDGVTYDIIQATFIGSTASVSTTASSTGRWIVQVSPFKYLRAEITTYSSGTVTVVGQGGVAGRPASSFFLQTPGGGSIGSGTPTDAQSVQTGLFINAQLKGSNGTTFDNIRTASIGDGAPATGLLAAGLYGWSGSVHDRLKSVNTGQLVVTMKSSAGTEVKVIGNATDGEANAEVGMRVQNYNYGYNNSSWDRWRNNTDATALASSARTATTNSSDIVNYNGKGILIWLDVTVASGLGGLTATLQVKDPVSGNYNSIYAATVPVITTGNKLYQLYPAASFGGTEVKSLVVGRTFRIQIAAGDGSSYTYSVGYSLVV